VRYSLHHSTRWLLYSPSLQQRADLPGLRCAVGSSTMRSLYSELQAPADGTFGDLRVGIDAQWPSSGLDAIGSSTAGDPLPALALVSYSQQWGRQRSTKISRSARW
jgi:hypothetical protein